MPFVKEDMKWRRPRNNKPVSETDTRPILQSTRCKSTISSLLLSTFSNETTNKKTNFSAAAATFRGLGCSAGASEQVSVPAVIRASADWEMKKKKKKTKKKKQKRKSKNDGVDFQDVWCAPGIGFSPDVAASVDCVVSKRNVNVSSTSRPKIDLHKITHTQIMVLQGSILMGGRRDLFRDWRLDVDNMSYEQLLELGERIGNVNTGLKEDEMEPYITKTKLQISDQVDKKCSICQEEYEVDDKLGRLNCDHLYHFQCIQQWVAHKNFCPVCKHQVAARR
ncbi:uncharacterized protein [Cicer arietinum]|uniref:RING-type E3 ubiquitin transferase n=1 Tax=Cicer arietinum TaxID=3827 RepID=A0A1S2YDQ6_CICAR|nr:uncharacterized protein LOC101510167 isoform X2 [Cicer arietinum]